MMFINRSQMRYYCFLIFTLLSFEVTSQGMPIGVDSLSFKGSKEIRVRLLNKSKIEFDSIKVSYSSYENIIETKNKFEDSNTEVSITFLLTGNTFEIVRITESSPKFKDCYLERQFQYESGNLSLVKDRCHVPAKLAELGIPRDKNIYELYGYNEALSLSFYKEYVLQLFNLIKGENSH